MSGPPGCGKSLLAESFSSTLPPLLPEFQLENMSLYELAGCGEGFVEEFGISPPENSRYLQNKRLRFYSTA